MMKGKNAFILPVINIAALVLVLSVILIPSNSIRVLVGIPFVAVLPGYTTYIALFVNRKKNDVLEVIAVSVAMSVIIVALISLLLNYTDEGVTVVPQMMAVEGFIVAMTLIAAFRQSRYRSRSASVINNGLSDRQETRKVTNGRIFSAVLFLSAAAFVCVLAYVIASPVSAEKYSEFYILGNDGQADRYPVSYVVNDTAVERIEFGDGSVAAGGDTGAVTLGIVNHEQDTRTYSVSLTIDGDPATLFGENSDDRQITVTLDHGEVWEAPVGFIPVRLGRDQKVEFLLYRNGEEPVLIDSVHFWINVSD